MKANNKLAGVIYIASESIYLRIVQLSNGKIKYIEKIDFPIVIGKETYKSRKISFKRINKACDILNNFRKLMDEYKVTNYKVVSTTAIRESENSEYIIDQIKIKTGLNLEILEDSEEKNYIYLDLIRSLDRKKFKNEDKILITYIGSGSLGIALYNNGNIIFSQNIRIGTLKLTETLAPLITKTPNFFEVIIEFLSSFRKSLKTILPTKEIDCIIACGKEIEITRTILDISKDKDFTQIDVKSLLDLFEKIQYKNPEQIHKMFNLTDYEAINLLPLFGVYKMLFDIVDPKRFLMSEANLLDSLSFEILKPDEFNKIQERYYESIIMTAKNLAKRFYYDEDHSLSVEKHAVKIFDSLKKLHGMGLRERLLLRVASILHDTGKAINIKNHAESSYYIVKESEILGLSSKELNIIGNIVRYHSGNKPALNDPDFLALSKDDRVLIAKLLAILRLADSFDRAHDNKVDNISVRLTKKNLYIYVETIMPAYLEKWSFEVKSDFFEDVFGIKPDFRRVIK